MPRPPAVPSLLRALVVLVALCVLTSATRAGELSLSAGIDSLSLNGSFDHLLDRGGERSLADMLAPDVAWDQSGRQSFGYDAQVHWFRLTLRRAPDAASDWVLRIGRPYLDHISVYLGEPGTDPRGWRHIELGDHVPVAERPLRDRLFSLPLHLPAERPLILMLRTKTTSSSLLDVDLLSPNEFAARQGNEGFIFGLFFGALGVLALLHLTLGTWIHDRSHVFYGLFALSQFVVYLFVDGLGPLVVNQVWPHLSDRAVSFGTGFSAAFAVAMWMHILRFRDNLPWAATACRITIGAFIVLSLIGWGERYTMVAQPAAIAMLVLTALAAVMSFYQLWRDPRSGPLKFYATAQVVALCGLSLHSSTLLGLLSVTRLPENTFQISSLAHMMLLSIALIYRIRYLEREHATARAEAAEAAARADGQRALVAMLSHEFRTPLASIHSAAQMIRFRHPQLDDNSGQRLSRIEDTARGLSALIDVFLAGEALTRGHITLDRHPCALHDLVAGVIRLLGPQAGRVIVEPFAERVIDADRQLLVVALRNCLANALAYSPPHTQVSLSIGQAEGLLTLSVADHGPGMSAEEIRTIGKPFFRGSASKGTSGSGLGLSMVLTIAAAHGGRMDIDSTAGRGTRIILALPLPSPDGALSENAPASPRPLGGPQPASA